MVKTAPWLKDLRGTIKRTYGPGWVLEERSGYFKIQRRETGNARDGKRPTITTSIAYAPSSSTELLVLIGELKRKMADLGIGLNASHALISGSVEDEATDGTNGTRLPSVMKPIALVLGKSKHRPTRERNGAGSNAQSN